MRMAMAAGAALVLAGCDAVKIPGVDRELPSPEPPPAATPAPQAGAPDEARHGASETNAPLPDEAVDPPVPAPEPAPPPRPAITNLAELNAVRCGLPPDAEDTLTLAQRSGAGVAPPSESLVGTAAVGGLAARLTAFPGIVKIEPRRIEADGRTASGHCGATRVTGNWFVTAAHCVDQAYDEIRFIMGVENLRDETAAEIASARISVCHRGYDGSGAAYTNDIALLRLPDDAAGRLATIPTANIADTEQTLVPFNYPIAEMAGWGLTGFTDSLSPILLSAPLTIVSTGPAQIIVSSRDGAGPCIGDSGGPLYVTEADGRKVVVGVLSVVEQNAEGGFCAGEYRGRYTNLQGYTDWMQRVIEACETDPALCR